MTFHFLPNNASLFVPIVLVALFTKRNTKARHISYRFPSLYFPHFLWNGSPVLHRSLPQHSTRYSMMKHLHLTRSQIRTRSAKPLPPYSQSLLCLGIQTTDNLNCFFFSVCLSLLATTRHERCGLGDTKTKQIDTVDR